MALPDYSVVIPTWNRASTIVRAVRGALDQTHAPLEVLVCDDASSDNTESLVRALDDPRVVWLPGPRGGRPAIPRNRGIRAARGEWVAFLDSDDAWLPGKMEKQFALAAQLGCQAACTNAARLLPGERESSRSQLDCHLSRIAFEDQLQTNWVITSSAAARRDLLLKAGCFPEESTLKGIEDYPLWLRLCTMTDFAMVREDLVLYLDEAADSVRNGQPDHLVVRRRILDNFNQWLRSQKQESELAAARLKMVKKEIRRVRRRIWHERLGAALRRLRPLKRGLLRLAGRA